MPVYEVISKLPGIEAVRSRSQAMAMLDAILCPDGSYRFFSFDSRWSPRESLASMRDGSGNDYSIAFSSAGAYARAFDHESPMTPWRSEPREPWPGLFEAVPAVFRSLVEEPAFCEADGIPRATACFWRQPSDAAWSAGRLKFPIEEHKDIDGTEWMFEVLIDGTAEGYRMFAEEYYEVVPDITAIRHVYELKPLTQEIVSALNPDVDLADLAEDFAQIGYPG
ncbi:hypothetical protein GXW83_01030 [Streptacidiphilus sp. PB12-B1b]|uniref:hypothetical protein n=1 Tax=Streptacidiphilus sp. PB12-B1b TaxID=2705012 RepID=UPI0015FCE09C|nr:hypothetical protein [Streptacidiphilus sp. PB12-B1b]QMU74578.1 hypothetical protein GXW83_01030 [Streptacidiphilus sp. PB12-B1b]